MIVGITGGFGSGKSFVASLFKRLGAKVIDADSIGHEALKKGSAAYRRVVTVFGKSILDTGGSIDRKKLGAIVFADKKKLLLLEAIVHPVIIGEIKREIRSHGKGVLIVDAPLICEAGITGLFDALIVVKSSRAKQIARCVKKFNIKKVDVCRRITCQMPLKSKMSKADYCIDNDGTRKGTTKQVKVIWQDLKRGKRVWR